MKVSTTSNRLKEYMKKYNLKQVDILDRVKPFCEEYGLKMNKSDLSQYVSGKTEPGQDKLFMLSKALKVSEPWLMGYDVPEGNPDSGNNLFCISNILPLPKTKKVPLLGTIACGKPILAEENIEEYVNLDKNINAEFALRCKGDSMVEARIFSGDIVYIHQQPDVENGEIAAVLIGEEATLKRVYKYPKKNMLVLKPANSKMDDFIFVGEELNDIHILGKAVAFLSMVR